jgi:hypothetical protein
MRHPIKTALIAGAALAAAGCNRGADNSSANAANEIGDNTTMSPGNDASAPEMATNSVEAMAPPAASDNSNEPVTGETSGGDTGGNNVDSNVSGM